MHKIISMDFILHSSNNNTNNHNNDKKNHDNNTMISFKFAEIAFSIYIFHSHEQLRLHIEQIKSNHISFNLQNA